MSNAVETEQVLFVPAAVLFVPAAAHTSHPAQGAAAASSHPAPAHQPATTEHTSPEHTSPEGEAPAGKPAPRGITSFARGITSFVVIRVLLLPAAVLALAYTIAY